MSPTSSPQPLHHQSWITKYGRNVKHVLLSLGQKEAIHECDAMHLCDPLAQSLEVALPSQHAHRDI